FVTVQAAQAKGARFEFAPNIWRQEGVRVPKSHGAEPVHSVRSGAVPQGTSFLGLAPHMLAPAPKPVAPQTQVAARVSVPQLTPQVAIPKTTYNSAFGKPVGQAAAPAQMPPVIASAPVAQPPLPQVATAKSLPPAKPAVKAVARRPAIQVSRNVSGKLRKPAAPAAPSGMIASAGKGIASYGKNFGYMPGAFLPAVGGDGLTTQADVHGRLIKP
ncbi:MAG TPA: hypothetical protein V6D08_14500, partial [Candidatus Obscuribacterales bacterium]